jgi:TonB family protein
MTNVKNSNPGKIPKGRGGANGFRIVGFPKEFERNFWEMFDKRYYAILLITWVILYAFTFYMSSREWRISESTKEQIRQNYLEQLYAEIAPPPAEVNLGEGEGFGMTTGEEEATKEELSETSKKLVNESVSDRVKRRRAGVGARRAKRRQMEQEAAGYGVLAALTAAGEGGTGSQAYTDILGEPGGVGAGLLNAGELVGGTAALEAATGSGQRSRIAKGGGFGAEVGETGIDALVSGTGVTEGTSVVRRGQIKLAQETSVSGAASSSAQRDPDVIDAVINQNKASVEYCYQSQLKVDPNLRGEILLSFDILPNGRVGAVKIMNSTLGNQQVERCIIHAVRRWSNFPRLTNSGGVVTIRTKFVFG